MIRVVDLHKHFGRVRAVDGTTLEIGEPGRGVGGLRMNLNPAVGGGDRPLGAVRAVDFGVDFSMPARPWAAAASADAPVRGHGGIS